MVGAIGSLHGQTVGGDLYAYHAEYGTHRFELAGSSVASAGDINGDGVGDYIVGRVGHQTGVGSVGAIQIYSGANHSVLLALIGSETGTAFGAVVAGVGDVDLDGIPDFAAGLPTAGSIGDEGQVLLYSGADASILYQLDGNPGDKFGSRVTAAGDVNQDGYADFLVGAPYEDRGNAFDVGAVHLYSGRTGGLYRRWKGKFDNSRVGRSFAGGGDINADGVPDILIGDPGAGGYLGAVYAYSGSDNQPLHEVYGHTDSVHGGAAVSFAGDVNEDGYDDFWVGDLDGDSQAGSRTGVVRRYSGKSGALQQEIGGSRIHQEFGCNIVGGADFDGDGKPDVAIGAQGAIKPWHYAGAVRVFTEFSDQPIMEYRGRKRGERVGLVMCALPDLDLDGKAELLVGVPMRDNESEPPLDSHGTGWFGILGYHPFLHASASQISAATGGTVNLTVDYSTVQESRPFRLLGSASGTGPSSFHGIPIPLTQGDFFWDLMLRPTPPVFLQNAAGSLDESGVAVSALQLPPNAATAYVGTTFSFAALVRRKGGDLISSIAVNVEVVP